MSAPSHGYIFILSHPVSIEALESGLSASNSLETQITFTGQAKQVNDRPIYKDWQHFSNQLIMTFEDGQHMELSSYYNPPLNGLVSCCSLEVYSNWDDALLFVREGRRSFSIYKHVFLI